MGKGKLLMECGVIYIKVCPPKGSSAEWLKYCYIFSELPKSLQSNIKHISDDINNKYSDDIVIPMDTMMHPGCTTKPDKVKEIATEMYNSFCDMMSRHNINNCVRCVYAIGDISDTSADSTHHIHKSTGIGYDEIMIKIGEFLDESDDPGIFELNNS